MQTFVINYDEQEYDCSGGTTPGSMEIDAVSAEDAIRAFKLCRPNAKVASISRGQTSISHYAIDGYPQ